MQRCDSKCQIINLGCGFDTLFWRLRDVTQAVGNFIELDFPAVTAKKCQIIKRNKQLLEKIANEGQLLLLLLMTAADDCLLFILFTSLKEITSKTQMPIVI